jgi:SAM-dependent methyltransferase
MAPLVNTPSPALIPKPITWRTYHLNMSSRSGFPSAADEWLVPSSGSRVLAVGQGSASMAARLHAAGHRVTLIEHQLDELVALQRRYPALELVAASAEGLPFQPCSFDVVVIAQGMHLLAPGLALAEFARVLASGGCLSLAYITRDDSVPWVRRLAAVLQTYDPELMTSGQVESVDALAANSYFPAVDERSFRMWVPITREGMLTMVSSAPQLAGLAEADSRPLLDAVGAIYDSSAKPPEPLALPYAVQCWRAEVDHSEFTSELDLAADGLQILL